MGLIRSATPGTAVTLGAVVLLALVSFNVPLLKSIYFLSATITTSGVTGTIKLGTLGYCAEILNNQACTKPSVGYEIDATSLLGFQGLENIPEVGNVLSQIPNTVIKWLTYVLVLHIVALGFAIIALLFGILAHIREFSMTCLSTVFSGIAAFLAFLSFAFDLALTLVARSRINGVDGASASLGVGVWLTLAAWLLLFFSGCFFGCGTCCTGRQRRRKEKLANEKLAPDAEYAATMREDAIRMEERRKASQAREGGLPAFASHDSHEPLTSNRDYDDEDETYQPYQPYRDEHAIPGVGAGYGPRRPGAAYAGAAGVGAAAAAAGAYNAYRDPSRTGDYHDPYAQPYAGVGAAETPGSYHTAPATTPNPYAPGPTPNPYAYGAPMPAAAAAAGGAAAGGYLAPKRQPSRAGSEVSQQPYGRQGSEAHGYAPVRQPSRSNTAGGYGREGSAWTSAGGREAFHTPEASNNAAQMAAAGALAAYHATSSSPPPTSQTPAPPARQPSNAGGPAGGWGAPMVASPIDGRPLPFPSPENDPYTPAAAGGMAGPQPSTYTPTSPTTGRPRGPRAFGQQAVSDPPPYEGSGSAQAPPSPEKSGYPSRW